MDEGPMTSRYGHCGKRHHGTPVGGPIELSVGRSLRCHEVSVKAFQWVNRAFP